MGSKGLMYQVKNMNVLNSFFTWSFSKINISLRQWPLNCPITDPTSGFNKEKVISFLKRKINCSLFYSLNSQPGTRNAQLGMRQAFGRTLKLLKLVVCSC